MSLKRINYSSGSTDVEAATLKQLRDDLSHPIIEVYVFIGKATEPGWKTGKRACGQLQPAVNLYLATSMKDVREWVPAGSAKGVVFGKDEQPDRLLNEAESSVTDIVVDALLEAI